jgi:2,4-dienoyl-CoA reductase-like NADH-dependent reductase (Old Yellow Enzyme family)
MLEERRHAEAFVDEGEADMVALARAFLADPRWGWRAAAALGQKFEAAPQFARAVGTMEGWVKAAG